ncbi:McrB family protein [Cylindrospermum stagnale]|nr:AAA family ATPase [Cylindrospermum stagnale]
MLEEINGNNIFTYIENNDFWEYLEKPFESLVEEVYKILPKALLNHLKGNHNWHSPAFLHPFNENDKRPFCLYYDFRLNSKLCAPELFIKLNNEGIKIGFSIDKHSSDYGNIFYKNCELYQDELDYIFDKIKLKYHAIYNYSPEDNQPLHALKHFLKEANFDEFSGEITISKEKILQISFEQLIAQILEILQVLSSLFLLGIPNDTMQKIYNYLDINPIDTILELADYISYSKQNIEIWLRVIERKKQAIFYGSPGTGKTFIVEKVAKYLISGGDGFSELLQFHPAYSYEDFIQGIRPQSQDGNLTYPLVPGRFLEFCKKAESCQDTCVLIIDEINRANLVQVFGELMYLLEYREREIPLAGGNTFRIPKNVRIIGTMNTADRSIAQIDHALRRRFAFIELRPNYDVLIKYHLKTGFAVIDLIKILEQVNQAIADKNYEIGVSFFLTDNLRDDIEDI